MNDYKTKCLSILEGVDWEKRVKEFPLIQSVHGNPVDGWELTDLGGKTIQCNQWMSVSDSVIAYALLSHRVPQPDENGLLPCPHCGGKSYMSTWDGEFEGSIEITVGCEPCRISSSVGGAKVATEQHQEIMRNRWNRRANQGGQNG